MERSCYCAPPLAQPLLWAPSRVTLTSLYSFRWIELGGLVKIAELTDKINLLERELNDLKSALGRWTPVKSDGGAALKLAITSWSAKQLSLTRRGDYEDTKVKH